MRAPTIQAQPWPASGGSACRERLADGRDRARQTLRRVTAVLVVFALGGALQAMRWTGMLVM